jgi:hypothetical protein
MEYKRLNPPHPDPHQAERQMIEARLLSLEQEHFNRSLTLAHMTAAFGPQPDAEQSANLDAARADLHAGDVAYAALEAELAKLS